MTCKRVGDHVGHFCVSCRQVITRYHTHERFFLNPLYVATDWQPLSSHSTQLTTQCVDTIIPRFDVEEASFKIKKKMRQSPLDEDDLKKANLKKWRGLYSAVPDDRIKYQVGCWIIQDHWEYIHNAYAVYIDHWADRSVLR